VSKTITSNTTDKKQRTTFRCQQADILFTSELRVQSASGTVSLLSVVLEVIVLDFLDPTG